jgi:hypothetical protein
VRPAARMSRGSGFHRGDAHGVSYHDYKTRTTQNCKHILTKIISWFPKSRQTNTWIVH